MNDRQTPWSTRVVLAAVAVQTCASLLLFGGPPGESDRLTAAGLGAAALLTLPANAVALVAAAWRARRRETPGMVLLGLSVVFLAWHVFALGMVAAWWSSGWELAAYIAGDITVSLVYQAAMCCSFAAVVVAGRPRPGSKSSSDRRRSTTAPDVGQAA